MKKFIGAMFAFSVMSITGSQLCGQSLSTLPDSVLEESSFDLGFSASSLSVSAEVGYESRYIFRGIQYASDSVQSKVDFAYPIYGIDVYAGAWMNAPVKGDVYGYTELDFYGGLSYSLGLFRLDLGYIYYYYSSDTQTPDDQEVYLGLILDTSSFLYGVNLNPAIYYFYNWENYQHVIEASLGYDTPIGSMLFGISSLTLPINVFVGYRTAGEFHAENWYNLESFVEYYGKTYWYAGASIDIAYAVTSYCTISAGARYSYADLGDYDIERNPYTIPSYAGENNLWFGGKVAFGF